MEAASEVMNVTARALIIPGAAPGTEGNTGPVLTNTVGNTVRESCAGHAESMEPEKVVPGGIRHLCALGGISAGSVTAFSKIPGSVPG